MPGIDTVEGTADKTRRAQRYGVHGTLVDISGNGAISVAGEALGPEDPAALAHLGLATRILEAVALALAGLPGVAA